MKNRSKTFARFHALFARAAKARKTVQQAFAIALMLALPGILPPARTWIPPRWQKEADTEQAEGTAARPNAAQDTNTQQQPAVQQQAAATQTNQSFTLPAGTKVPLDCCGRFPSSQSKQALTSICKLHFPWLPGSQC